MMDDSKTMTRAQVAQALQRYQDAAVNASDRKRRAAEVNAYLDDPESDRSRRLLAKLGLRGGRLAKVEAAAAKAEADRAERQEEGEPYSERLLGEEHYQQEHLPGPPSRAPGSLGPDYTLMPDGTVEFD